MLMTEITSKYAFQNDKKMRLYHIIRVFSIPVFNFGNGHPQKEKKLNFLGNYLVTCLKLVHSNMKHFLYFKIILNKTEHFFGYFFNE